MDAETRQDLLTRFGAYLDTAGGDPVPPDDDRPPEADLHGLFLELAALRNEVRTESRLVKEALDQTRGVVEPLRVGNAALEQALRRTEAEAQERVRAALKPVLLDLLEVRDRLAAGLAAIPVPRRSLFARLFGRRTAADYERWREGTAMTLRRLDRLLQSVGVTPVALEGRPFDPKLAKVVATEDHPDLAAGVVLTEHRAGFLWQDALLRLAEVTVNKRATDGRAPDEDSSP